MLLKLLREHLRPHRRTLLVIVVLQVAGTLAALAVPALNASLIDDGIARHDTAAVWQAGSLMIAAAVGQFAALAGVAFLGPRVAMAVGASLRDALFTRAQEFSVREVAAFGAPSLITRITNDVQQVQMLVVLAITMLAPAPLTCLGGIILALRQDAPLSAALLVDLPAMTVIFVVIVRRLRAPMGARQRYLDAVNSQLREQVSGVRVIRAFSLEAAGRERFARTNDDLQRVAVQGGFLLSSMYPLILVLANVSSVAALWFGAHLVAAGSLKVGALTAFTGYLMIILMTVMLATFTVLLMPRAAVSAQRISQVLRTPPSLLVAARPVRRTAGRGRVELKEVTFSYPAASMPALRGVSLAAEPGQFTAITGSTGSGKTTLLSLIPRLADPSGGRVLLDGVDMRELAPSELARAIGYVPQRAHLFAGSIATNLRFASPGASDAELWRALEIAQARDFVAALSGGLAATVAPGGTNLSGGQRQRLAIARALVHQSAVYLFDDAFSALDQATSAALRAALAEQTAGATTIVATQQLATVTGADRIVVLEGGRVAGAGTHGELMRSCAVYQEIAESQDITQRRAA